VLITERRRPMVTQSKIENPKLPLPNPDSPTPKPESRTLPAQAGPNPGSFTVLGVRVDAVQIPDVIELIAAIGRVARAEYEAKYTGERNYPMLMDIYRRVIKQAA